MLAFFVNLVLATALLAVVPRLRMSPRRLLPSVLLVAFGITLLNTVGRYYVVRVERNPAYTVVAGAVGLLIYPQVAAFESRAAKGGIFTRVTGTGGRFQRVGQWLRDSF